MPDEMRPHADPPARSFTVRDAMILVAATAVGVFGYRINYSILAEMDIGPWGLFGKVRSWEYLYGPGLTALSAALVVVRLLSPRPSRVALFRRMGFVASCVALALTTRCFADNLLFGWLVGPDDEPLMFEWRAAIQEASVGILVTWSVLVLADCLWAGRGWIDRALEAVAILWVLSGLASRLVLLFT